MIRLKKINTDSSWLITIGGTRVLLDPWLVGKDIDVGPWFNQETLKSAALTIEECLPADYIILSHPFSDHCNIPTLSRLPKNIPVIAVPQAAKKVKALGHFDTVMSLEGRCARKPFRISNISIAYEASPKALDKTHNAVFIGDAVDGGTLCYCPHGINVNRYRSAYAHLKNGRPTALITTFTHFELPGILGGSINLGTSKAVSLINFLQPQTVIRTHDAKKNSSGLVHRLSKKREERCPKEMLIRNGIDVSFKDIQQNEEYTLQS